MMPREFSPLWGAPDPDAGDPMSCLATTYEFNADFFERTLLTRFLGLRYDDVDGEQTKLLLQREEKLSTIPVAVLVDARKVSAEQTTIRWDQVPIRPPRGSVQHSKVSILAWERWVRVIVGSANLTRPGYETNRELSCVLDFYDAPESVPREVLFEVLDFVQRVMECAACAPAVINRIAGQIERVRSLANGWLKARQSFAEKDLPRLHFVPGFPGRSDHRRAKRVLSTVLSLWGNRPVQGVSILTPFVDTGEKAQVTLVRKFDALRFSKRAMVELLLPAVCEESDDTEIHMVRFEAPGNFARVCTSVFSECLWKGILPTEWSDARQGVTRTLHSKALILRGKSLHLALIGSSNFTSRGMGTGSQSIEANICLIYQSSAVEKLEENWLLGDGVELACLEDAKIEWNDALITPEDDPETLPLPLPSFFEASYLQVPQREDGTSGQAILTFTFKLQSGPIPEAWSISIPGKNPLPVLQGDDTWPKLEEEVTLSTEVPPLRIRVLTVTWKERDGLQGHGLLPVTIRDASDIPLDDIDISCTVDEILAHLIARRDVARAFEWREARGQTSISKQPAFDPLHLVSTDGYLLYRTRRLGRALAGAAARIAETPATEAAMRFRLLIHPFGLAALGRALVQQMRGDQQMGDSMGAAQGCVFGLAELILMAGYAGEAAQKRAVAGAVVLAPFREVVKVLESLADASCVPCFPGDDVIQYLVSCRKEAGKRLKTPSAT